MKEIIAAPRPVEWAINTTSVLAIAASLLGLPVFVRFPIVFGFLAFVPGYALVRYLNLDDQLHVLLLSLAMSIGVASGVSALALYAGWWSPNGILIAIGLITIVAGTGDTTARWTRIARQRDWSRYRPRSLLKRGTDVPDSV
jgi:uncharacterized membrane protein